ncbi:MAG TPA: hypothetical protein VL974_10785 [Magnetospirillum sp.]|jgi:hypothetical protein|nr:hypothetical protein [Magnetospirillum sp.]
MRAILRAAVLALPLISAACGPAGVVANSAVKRVQGDNAADLERAIKTQMARNPSLRDIQVSVAISNVWQDAFQTRYSVLLAGTLPSEEARREAYATTQSAIGAGDDAVLIADQTRIAPPR